MPDDSSDNVLTLKCWRKTSNGDIKGDVYGHSNHEDGATIRIKSASIISNNNILEHEGYLLPTLGNQTVSDQRHLSSHWLALDYGCLCPFPPSATWR